MSTVHYHCWKTDPLPDVTADNFDLLQPPQPPRQRVAQACKQCRVLKRKCSGERPGCRRCVSRMITCTYSHPEWERPIRRKNSIARRKKAFSCETTPALRPRSPVMLTGVEACMQPMDQYPSCSCVFLHLLLIRFANTELRFPSCWKYASQMSQTCYPVIQHGTRIMASVHPGFHTEPVHTCAEMDHHHHIVPLQRSAERIGPTMGISSYSYSQSSSISPPACSPNRYQRLYPPSPY